MPDPVTLPLTDLIQFEEHSQEPLKIRILNPGEKSKTPAPAMNADLPPDFNLSLISAVSPKHLCPTSEPFEDPLSKGPMEIPAKKHATNQVRLVVNIFSPPHPTPVTKLCFSPGCVE